MNVCINCRDYHEYPCENSWCECPTCEGILLRQLFGDKHQKKMSKWKIQRDQIKDEIWYE